MTSGNIEQTRQNEIDARWVEIDKIFAEGWDAVVEGLRMTSVRLIEPAANIYAHRKPAMTIFERRDSGLLDLSLGIHIDDLVNLIRSFRTPKLSDFKLAPPVQLTFLISQE